MVEEDPIQPFVGHDGGISGYPSILYYYPKQRLTPVAIQNVTRNREQQVALLEELHNKFGQLEPGEKRDQLADAYLEKKYPTMYEQQSVYNFANPLVDFFDQCFN